jgi:hypothetical protein
MINRRHFMAALIAAAVSKTTLAAESPQVTVYLNPT